MKRGGNTMEIGQQIKKYRDQLHLSQEQLADKIYVTRQTISNEEVKETVLKLSNYAETINQKIKIKLFWLTIAALLGMIAFLVIETLGLNTPDSLYEYIASAGLGLDFGMLIVIAMYLLGVLGKIKARRMKLKNIH